MMPDPGGIKGPQKQGAQKAKAAKWRTLSMKGQTCIIRGDGREDWRNIKRQ